MAFRFDGTRIIGPRGDSGSLIFTAENAAEFTGADRLVFYLSRRGSGGVLLTRAMEIDGDGRAVLELAPADTAALAPAGIKEHTSAKIMIMEPFLIPVEDKLFFREDRLFVHKRIYRLELHCALIF